MRHIAIERQGCSGQRKNLTKIKKQQPKMRVTNIYRLNEVLHRLIKKHKGNKNIQQTDRTFTFRILKLKISF